MQLWTLLESIYFALKLAKKCVHADNNTYKYVQIHKIKVKNNIPDISQFFYWNLYNQFRWWADTVGEQCT